MEYFDYKFSYNELDIEYLQKHKITYAEIKDGFYHDSSEWIDVTDYPEFDNLYHFISFCTKYRFLRVYLTYTEDSVTFLDVRLADEEEIRKYYCGK